ncbi:MAG: hypothetical protein ACI9F9_002401 [Candidatus Paceibacteria bacterium]
MRDSVFLLCLLSAPSCNTQNPARSIPGQTRHFGLSERSTQLLAQEEDTLDQLDEVLVAYFGEPDAPRLMMMEEWESLGLDQGQDPFRGKWPDLEQRGVLLESLREDNRRVWSE